MNDDHDLTQQRMGALAGALFLFGLALVIWLDILLPGIFAVIWVTAIPPLLVEKGWRMTLWIETQMAVWFGGIGYMLDRGSIWPGIFVLMGLSVLLVAIAPPDHLEALHEDEQQRRHQGKAKRKRGSARLGIPVPDDAVQDTDDAAWTGQQDADQTHEQHGGHNG